jgi:hypothetical protein
MENVTIQTRTTSKWIYAIVVTLLFQFNLAAAPIDPPTDFGTGDNPTDAPAAPIDDYVFVLLAIGIGFAFYKFKAKSQKPKEEGKSH